MTTENVTIVITNASKINYFWMTFYTNLLNFKYILPHGGFTTEKFVAFKEKVINEMFVDHGIVAEIEKILIIGPLMCHKSFGEKNSYNFKKHEINQKTHQLEVLGRIFDLEKNVPSTFCEIFSGESLEKIIKDISDYKKSKNECAVIDISLSTCKDCLFGERYFKNQTSENFENLFILFQNFRN